LTYKTRRGINILLKKLQSKTALGCRISQCGDFEVCIAFNEKNIREFAELLTFNYRRQITEKQRKILIERLKKARFVKNGGMIK
jgi:hypothetical protein